MVYEKLDHGAIGKQFEAILKQGFDIVGLGYQNNNVGKQSMWDIKTYGDGWQKLVNDKFINIKTFKTKWLFSSVDLVNMLPWEDPKAAASIDLAKSAKRIKRLLVKKGATNVVFLKPKTEEIQNGIIKAVKQKDKQSLNELLVKKNFYIFKIPKDATIGISTSDRGIGSITIKKGDVVLARSERPRALGGTPSVTFRMVSTKPPKGSPKNIKKEEAMLKQILEGQDIRRVLLSEKRMIDGKIKGGDRKTITAKPDVRFILDPSDIKKVQALIDGNRKNEVSFADEDKSKWTVTIKGDELIFSSILPIYKDDIKIKIKDWKM